MDLLVLYVDAHPFVYVPVHHICVALITSRILILSDTGTVVVHRDTFTSRADSYLSHRGAGADGSRSTRLILLQPEILSGTMSAVYRSSDTRVPI